MIRRWRRLAAAALDRRLGPLHARIDALERQLAELGARLEGDVLPVLRTLAADDPGHRRRLHALRADPAYAAAWDDPDPLVTVAIPTRDRPRLLLERSLPSVLAQTHGRLEVLVVGDAAGPEVGEAVAGVGDPRVRFADLTHRVLRDDGRHWLTAATLPRNEAYRLAQGLWLVDLDDDDALRPDAVAALLARARADRAEVVYGALEQHRPDGTTETLGGFPPAFGRFGWQGALVHVGLRCFERELVAADLGLPGDWFRLQRMLRAGVRIAHLERVTADYYPATLWQPGGA